MESKNTVQEKINPDRWIIQVRDNLQIEEEEQEELSLCVFNVPKDLLAAKPEAYTPQCVSIGPYHHWRSELNEMERYKLAAARAFQKRIDGHRFESIVKEVRNYERRIRSCYHKYLEYNGEALAWLMALDACFALECLQFLGKRTYQDSSEGTQVPKCLDPFGRSATHNAIMRDLTMLENQLPLFLLQKLMEIQLGSKDMAEERLCILVRLACIEFSPFLFNVPDSSRLRITERSHILEALYFSLFISPWKCDLIGKGDGEEQRPSLDRKRVAQEHSSLWKAFSSLDIGPIREFRKRVLRQRVIQFLIKLPLRLLSVLGKLPVLRLFKEPLTSLFGSNEAEKEGERSSSVETPPTRDELAVPCVADLSSAGVKFLPTDGDLTTIRFDQASATLYLPKMRLDSNTEVIIRNLVAFEASVVPSDLSFIRYADFMNGIIDTDEDVRVLRESGIIYNHLENDGKVASLWNGMGKCVKLSKNKCLDKVIADMNRYYKRTWSVAVVEYMKKYIFGSWPCLSLLAAIILLLLTCLEAFCSIYNCKRWMKDTNLFQE
ncbi:hypothetical protein SUGI_0720390 [Cryptomeria japonica]|uniref:putative UPF0481 protein At3g02645 n=1 Tax=Cryptomeria japonica TaxID=3369 RepID=UPI002414CFE2|nr:putative UPF0481 protein At3g02645 [Cryptomeria japonica]GLJ35904.1 hypothetical protein SUGI_0720390 [Cryptomeria japonica]